MKAKAEATEPEAPTQATLGRPAVYVPYARNRIALAVLRGLAPYAECHTIDTIRTAMCRGSRLSHGYQRLQPDELIHVARHILSQGNHVFPTFEESWGLRRQGLFKNILPKPEVIDRANNKWHVHNACLLAGVPTPKTEYFEACVVKPTTGRGGEGRTFHDRVIAQARAYGDSYGVGMLWHKGDIRALCSWKRVDATPQGWGITNETVIIPAQEQAAVKLMGSLGWDRGPCMVEFVGEHVIEVNPRFWGSLDLSIHAGVNFPKLVLDIMETGDCKDVLSWAPGVRSTYLAAALLYRKRSDRHTMDFTFRDPLPFMLQFLAVGSNLLRGKGLKMEAR